MTNKRELTYILGAGASYQSMPVVATFANRFKIFVSFLKECKEQEISRFSTIYSYANRLSEDFEAHVSFDTYFKKLFHTENNDKILVNKKILNLYFLWEHLEKGKLLYNTNLNEKFYFNKLTKIDKRYDALIAGLLKPISGEKTVFCKTNFITWNYDLNLFLSLKNYFSPEKTIKAFLEEIQVDDNTWNIQNQIIVINMNGYFYSQHLNEFKNIQEIDFSVIRQKLLQEDYISHSANEFDSKKIKFAWETQKNEFYSHARKMIDSSINITVIGYTFPLYNRLVDLNFFNKETLNNKNLYIQDPNAIEITENIMESFELKTKATFTGDFSTNLKQIINCDNFFVPNNIYRISYV